MAEANELGRIGRTRIALYGAVNLPTSVVGLPIALYIPAFYSQNLGLSLAAVGALLALSRLTDVVTDPLIGILSDRWRTRFGRRKPWMVAGTPLMLLSLWMLFVPDSPVAIATWSALGGSAVDNLYLFVWISALYLAFTLVDLPYRAWGAELSPDYDERSRVTGWREAFGYGGTMMSLIIPLAIAFGLARPGAENALYGVALAVLVLMPVLAFPAIAFVREPPLRGSARPQVTWRRGLQIVWRNGPFRRLVICFVFFATAISMTTATRSSCSPITYPARWRSRPGSPSRRGSASIAPWSSASHGCPSGVRGSPCSGPTTSRSSS